VGNLQEPRQVIPPAPAAMCFLIIFFLLYFHMHMCALSDAHETTTTEQLRCLSDDRTASSHEDVGVIVEVVVWGGPQWHITGIRTAGDMLLCVCQHV